jgi:F-type H+-transporting ATPase subunit gamma
MSETLEGLHHKIEGAVELGSVVRTMKALAASSIAQYERAVISLDEYYRTVELGLVACLRQNEGAPVHAHKVHVPRYALPHPNPDTTTSHSTKLPENGNQVAGYLPEGRAQRGGRSRTNERLREFDVGATALVVFGSDQGLVGQYNEVLADFVAGELAGVPGSKRILVVGERIRGHLDEASLQAGFSVPNSIAAITQLTGRILTEIEALRGEVEEVYLFHNRPKSGAVYEPVMQRLLPLDQKWREGLKHLVWPTNNLPQTIGNNDATLQALIREYLFISLFRACAEALASENEARLVAMRRAEKNIDELLGELNQDFHRQRQTSIDEELFDVIAGYELLSHNRHGASSTPEHESACAGRFPHPNPDTTTSHSTKLPENGNQVAGYLPEGRAQRGGRSRTNESLRDFHGNGDSRRD